MKPLFLNELSISPLADDFTGAWERVHKFITTYKSRPVDIFENRICSDEYLGNIKLTPDLDLQTFCRHPKGGTLGRLLLGLTKHPYIDQDSPQEDKFIEASYFVLKDEKKVSTNGLAAAFLHDSIGISFISEKFWEGLNFTLLVTDQNNSVERQSVLSVSCPSHFENADFSQWKDTHTEIEIILSPLNHEMKSIHLRDDHGKTILDDFAKKLIRSPYIVGVINSLPFNPSAKKFIKAIKPDGVIEIVLPFTDQGLGLVVQTTGRNLRETTHIAAILNKEFGS
jgi:hypothetical protein